MDNANRSDEQDVSLFWEFEGYAGFPAKSESGNPRVNGDGLQNPEDCGRGVVSHAPHLQEIRGPLGLTLRKEEPFISLLEMRLSVSGEQDNVIRPKKSKASNFPIVSIKIGKWQMISTKNEGELIAKLYYAKQKLVWEVLDGPLKSKMEIQWSDITGIKANMDDNQPGILEIELDKPPSFFRESNPQPRKHTIWQQSPDITGGDASIWRIHSLRFPPGVLNKHYQSLLQFHPELVELSRQPFPSQESPFFRSAIPSGIVLRPQPVRQYRPTTIGAPIWPIPNPTISGTNINIGNYQPMNFPRRRNINIEGQSWFTCHNQQSNMQTWLLDNFENQSTGSDQLAVCRSNEISSDHLLLEQMLVPSNYHTTTIDHTGNDQSLHQNATDNFIIQEPPVLLLCHRPGYDQVLHQNATDNYIIEDPPVLLSSPPGNLLTIQDLLSRAANQQTRRNVY